MALPLQLLLLALIQGLAEFLPVSSSGHLVIAQHLLRFSQPPLITDIVLHLGTLTAVFLFFFRDIAALLRHPLQPENRRLMLMLIVASLPTAIMGLAFQNFFEGLFSSPRAVGVALWITAILLLAAKKLRIKVFNPYAAALVVGIFQGLAIAPGISRSGATIAAALVVGWEFGLSFRFSFLLSIPAVLGATLLEARDISNISGPILPLAAAFLVAAAVGLLALSLLRRVGIADRLHTFAYYCLAAGLIVIVIF